MQMVHHFARFHNIYCPGGDALLLRVDGIRRPNARKHLLGSFVEATNAYVDTQVCLRRQERPSLRVVPTTVYTFAEIWGKHATLLASGSPN